MEKVPESKRRASKAGINVCRNRAPVPRHSPFSRVTRTVTGGLGKSGVIKQTLVTREKTTKRSKAS